VNRFAVLYAATPRLLRTLLVAMAGLYVVFLLAALVASVAPGAGLLVRVFEWLALEPQQVASRPWSVVTHPLTHPVLGFWGLIGLLFGLSFLNVLGRDATELLGERWFGLTCLAATLGASVLALLAYWSFGVNSRAEGPWPLVMGLAMALGIRFPDKTIGLFLIGAVRLIVLVPVFLVLSILLNANFFAAVPEVGAALGGLGWAYASRGRRITVPTLRVAKPKAERARTEPTPAARTGATQAEVDRILDKISAQGSGSLTPEERRVLEEASRRR
jgi:hypothetical protein